MTNDLLSILCPPGLRLWFPYVVRIFHIRIQGGRNTAVFFLDNSMACSMALGLMPWPKMVYVMWMAVYRLGYSSAWSPSMATSNRSMAALFFFMLSYKTRNIIFSACPLYAQPCHGPLQIFNVSYNTGGHSWYNSAVLHINIHLTIQMGVITEKWQPI